MANIAKFLNKLHLWIAVTVVVVAIWEYFLRRREKQSDNFCQ